MTTQLKVTKKVENGSYVIEAEVMPGGELPQAIFLFQNIGKAELGPFYSVSTLSDLLKCKEFTGEMVPVFGNRFLRGKVAKIVLDRESEADEFVRRLLVSVQSLKTSYTQKTSETTIYDLQ